MTESRNFARAPSFGPWLRRALTARVTREEIGSALAFGFALYVLGLVFSFQYDGDVFDFDAVQELIVLAWFEIVAFTLLAGIVVADRVPQERWRVAAYALAVVLAGIVRGVWQGWSDSITNPEVNVFATHGHYFQRVVFWQLYQFIVIGGVATFVYIDRRRVRTALVRRHTADLERTRTAKRALESRLQAMQARVEPQFLFNTLAQVKRTYEIDPALAQRMLDDLIAYLRAAMPRMRDTSSTVGQEIELARAYLAIVKVRLGDRLQFDIAPPGELAGARMPPMMLLPLIDHAVVHGLEPSQAAGTIRIAIENRDSRLRLTIADSGAGFVPEIEGDGIAGIRERLQALYGEGARLELDRNERPGTQALMEIPFEVQAADDERGAEAPALAR